MRKLKKQTKDLIGISMLSAGGSIGVTALGGSAKPMGNMMRFAPAAGSMMGAGMMMRSLRSLEPKKKKKYY